MLALVTDAAGFIDHAHLRTWSDADLAAAAEDMRGHELDDRAVRVALDAVLREIEFRRVLPALKRGRRPGGQ